MPALYSSSLAAYDDGLEELIRFSLLVAFPDCFHGIGAIFTCPVDDTIHGSLNPVPALVTVHGVVPTHHGCHLTNAKLSGLVKKLLQVPCSGLWIRISAVPEEMNVDLWNPRRLGHLQQTKEMFDVRMLRPQW